MESRNQGNLLKELKMEYEKLPQEMKVGVQFKQIKNLMDNLNDFDSDEIPAVYRCRVKSAIKLLKKANTGKVVVID